MSSTAAQLVERVLPDLPMRQWVFTLPQPLPRLLAWRPDLLERILADISRVVQDDLRRRTGEPGGRGGLVSFVQNFTGDLRCFVHVHSLVPDGVFVEEAGGEVRFVRAPIPKQSELQAVAVELAGRVTTTVKRWLGKRETDGLGQEMLDDLGRLGEEQVGESGGRGRERPAARQRRWLAAHRGFGIHAGVTVEEGDARGRERLARYMARPALALGRLHWEADGRVRIDFKQPWRNGVSAIRLRPEVFVLRLASLVMPPGVNLVRYHGVFAPASPLRSRVVPPPPAPSKRPSRWIRWVNLFKRVFGHDPSLCPACGSPMTRMQTLQGSGRAWPVLVWIRRRGNLVRLSQPP
jgi:hypothetical protein